MEKRIAEVEQRIASAHAELDQLRTQQAEQRRARSGGARLATLSRTASSSQILAALRQDGVVAIVGLAPQEQMCALQSELAQLEPFISDGDPDGFGAGHRTNGSYLVPASPTSQELALHPVLTEVAETLLSPHAQRIALAVAVEFKIDGEKRAQELHRDDEECEHTPTLPGCQREGARRSHSAWSAVRIWCCRARGPDGAEAARGGAAARVHVGGV
jgi:hypothetical protein